MLSKLYRLKKEKDINRVFKVGRSFFTKELGLKFAPNETKKSRYAFVVSKKISKKAVERNKIRRRLSEIIRISLPLIKPGSDMIFFARPCIREKKYQEIQETIMYIIKKTGQLQKK